MTALYSVPYFRTEMSKKIIGPSRVREYYTLINVFSATMFLAVAASQPVVAWIFLEATTLSTAFLISYYNNRSTVEAAWKYLVLNSTGLLIGFFGTLLYFTSRVQDSSTGFIS
jgi:hydrogenase-4 component F